MTESGHVFVCEGYQAMTKSGHVFVLGGTKPWQRLVIYLCVRGYQAMTESDYVFVC
jgi:hypothetical protein